MKIVYDIKGVDGVEAEALNGVKAVIPYGGAELHVEVRKTEIIVTVVSKGEVEESHRHTVEALLGPMELDAEGKFVPAQPSVPGPQSSVPPDVIPSSVPPFTEPPPTDLSATIEALISWAARPHAPQERQRRVNWFLSRFSQQVETRYEQVRTVIVAPGLRLVKDGSGDRWMEFGSEPKKGLLNLDTDLAALSPSERDGLQGWFNTTFKAGKDQEG